MIDIVALGVAFIIGMFWGAACILIGQAIKFYWLHKQYKAIVSKLLRHRRNGRGGE